MKERWLLSQEELGIGKGIVEVFAAQGAKVALLMLVLEKAQELEKSLSSVTQIKVTNQMLQTTKQLKISR